MRGTELQRRHVAGCHPHRRWRTGFVAQMERERQACNVRSAYQIPRWGGMACTRLPGLLARLVTAWRAWGWPSPCLDLPFVYATPRMRWHRRCGRLRQSVIVLPKPCLPFKGCRVTCALSAKIKQQTSHTNGLGQTHDGVHWSAVPPVNGNDRPMSCLP